VYYYSTKGLRLYQGAAGHKQIYARNGLHYVKPGGIENPATVPISVGKSGGVV